MKKKLSKWDEFVIILCVARDILVWLIMVVIVATLLLLMFGLIP